LKERASRIVVIGDYKPGESLSMDETFVLDSKNNGYSIKELSSAHHPVMKNLTGKDVIDITAWFVPTFNAYGLCLFDREHKHNVAGRFIPCSSTVRECAHCGVKQVYIDGAWKNDKFHKARF